LPELKIINEFELNKKEMLHFSPVKISEFRVLNEELQKMTHRIQQDYQNLKEFTENASHEIQTPLAIMQSKLELMIQWENLSPDQMKLLKDMYRIY
jgi:signal transduction histidine kinase